MMINIKMKKRFIFSFLLFVFACTNDLLAAPNKRPEVIKTKTSKIDVLKVLNNSSDSYFIKLNKLRKNKQTTLATLVSIYNDESISFQNRWMSLMYYARIAGKKRSFNQLNKALYDRQWFIRSASAKAFGYMKHEKAVPTLINALDDKSLVVRTSVVDALGQIGSKTAIKPLIKALYSSNNFYKGKSLWVREHIVKALMDIGDPLTINSLISLLDDTDPKVVQMSLKALTKITGRNYSGTLLAKNIESWKTWQKDSGKFEKSNVSISINHK